MNQLISIRGAMPDDIHEIGRLCGQLGYQVEHDALQERLAWIINDTRQFVCVAVTDNDRVVGWVHALPVCYLEADLFIEIGGLVVDSSCHRMGVGRALMAAVEGWARDCGITTIRLRSNTKREAAHEFYRSIGYEVVKQQYTFVKQI